MKAIDTPFSPSVTARERLNRYCTHRRHRRTHMLSEADKLFLLARAGYRCEYCRSTLTDYQIEHISPLCLGGMDETANLAVACPRCNRNKGGCVEAEDPHTWLTVPLFNPRSDQWPEHFSQSHGETVGVTPIGRATAGLLFRSTSQTLSPDLRWDKITVFEDDFTLYQYFNNLRNWRLQNRFDLIIPEFNRLSGLIQQYDSFRQREALFVRGFLKIETLFTRSRPEDICAAILITMDLIKQHREDRDKVAALLSMISILCRQKATLCAIQGDLAVANQFQRVSGRYYYLSHPLVTLDPGPPPRTALESYLRYYSTVVRYSSVQVNLPLATIEESVRMIQDMDAYSSTTHLSYLMDTLRLQAQVPARLINAVYSRVSNILETEGYGTRNDTAKMVTLRRRWWPLHLLLDDSTSMEMFARDIEMWSDIQMSNEIRELKDSLISGMANAPAGRFSDALLIIEKYLERPKVIGPGGHRHRGQRRKTSER